MEATACSSFSEAFTSSDRPSKLPPENGSATFTLPFKSSIVPASFLYADSSTAVSLSAYLEQCEAEGPIVITRNGNAVAVLLAPHYDDDLERLLLSRYARFQTLLDKSRQSIKRGKGLSDEAIGRWLTSARKSGKGNQPKKSAVRNARPYSASPMLRPKRHTRGTTPACEPGGTC